MQSRLAAPQGDILVDEAVGRTFDRQLGSRYGEHVGAATELVREQQYVGVNINI